MVARILVHVRDLLLTGRREQLTKRRKRLDARERGDVPRDEETFAIRANAVGICPPLNLARSKIPEIVLGDSGFARSREIFLPAFFKRQLCVGSG